MSEESKNEVNGLIFTYETNYSSEALLVACLLTHKQKSSGAHVEGNGSESN